MIDGITEIRSDPSRLYIYWMLTDWCNFSCTYCSKGVRLGESVPFQPSLAELMSFCDQIGLLARSGHQIELNISGGEPTVHRYFSDIFARLDTKIHTTVTTNGSRPTAWWKNLDLLPDHVIFSIHRQTNTDRVAETARYILSMDRSVAFNCSMDTGDWTGSTNRYEIFSELFGYRARKKIINMLDPTGYIQTDPQILTDEQRDFVRSPHSSIDPYPENTISVRNTNHAKLGNMSTDIISAVGETTNLSLHEARSVLVRNDLNHWKGWSCNAGIESFQITSTGVVWAGVCRMKKIGHIADFKPSVSPLICGKTTCPCPADITVSKKAL